MRNKVMVHGRLTRDVDLEDMNGFALAKFTVASSRKYKETETKCFLDCKAWREKAKFVSNYFHKGSEVVLWGELQTEEWETDGKKRSRLVCNVEEIEFCGSKSEQATESAPKPSPDDFVTVPDTDSEELPFV